MSVGRRAFLQLVAGGIGGTLLSPLPWKLADDTAIWSQNWWWRPSPEDGEMVTAPTVCPYCGGGIRAQLVDGKRAIAVEGNPDHPVNEGGVCPVCASGIQYYYAPYRVTQPMKQPCMWLTALCAKVICRCVQVH